MQCREYREWSNAESTVCRAMQCREYSVWNNAVCGIQCVRQGSAWNTVCLSTYRNRHRGPTPL